MSRRNPIPGRSPKSKHKPRSVFTQEWGIRNYLSKNKISDIADTQTIIINSFYNSDQFFGLSNEDSWKDKILFTQQHFGKFAQYAQNNWKGKTKHEN